MSNLYVSLCQRLLIISTTKRFGFPLFDFTVWISFFVLFFLPYTLFPTQMFWKQCSSFSEFCPSFPWRIFSESNIASTFFPFVVLSVSSYGCTNFFVILSNYSMLTEKIHFVFYSFPCFNFWYVWNSDRFLVPLCWCQSWQFCF